MVVATVRWRGINGNEVSPLSTTASIAIVLGNRQVAPTRRILGLPPEGCGQPVSSLSFPDDGNDHRADADGQHDPQVLAHRQIDGLNVKLEHGARLPDVKSCAS
jgi:hypothetical protein